MYTPKINIMLHAPIHVHDPQMILLVHNALSPSLHSDTVTHSRHAGREEVGGYRSREC